MRRYPSPAFLLAACVLSIPVQIAPARAEAPIGAAEKEALTALSDAGDDSDTILTWFNFQSDEGISQLLAALRGGKLDEKKEISAFWNLTRISRENLTTPASRQRIQTFLAETRGGAGRLKIHADLAAFGPAPAQDPKLTWAAALKLLRAHGILGENDWHDQQLALAAPNFRARLNERFRLDHAYGEKLLDVLSTGADALMAPGNEGGGWEYPASRFERAREALRLMGRAPEANLRAFLAKHLLNQNLLAGVTGAGPAAPAFAEELPLMKWSQSQSANIGRCGGPRGAPIYQGSDARDLPFSEAFCPQGGDNGRGQVKVHELITSRPGNSEATYTARVGMWVHGGYDRKAGENATATVEAITNGTVEFPACQSATGCDSELSIRWEGSDNAVTDSETRATSVKLTAQGNTQEIPAGQTVRVSRRTGPVTLSVNLRRERRHRGGCCTPEASDQKIVISVKKYPTKFRGRLADRPAMYADALAGLRPSSRFAALRRIFFGPAAPVDFYAALASDAADAEGDLSRLRFAANYSRLFLIKQYLDAEGANLSAEQRQALEGLEAALAAKAKAQFAGTVKAELSDRQNDLAILSPMAMIGSPIATLLAEPVIGGEAWMSAGVTIAESKTILQKNGYELPAWAANRLTALRALLYIRDARDRLERQKNLEADILQSELSQLESK